ncbi:integrase arm-type DNA-binding domain-containing protein [Salinisphaera sp. LB1]|uniref:tyrosine-type recombinase/integrase n=1 Tax=Salinisphaera sp. LB1 TaxID=2183911 RepID=UPI000D708249|nr:integrase arm-type DNA-binding domain-containing protein [Salinisphaera sp. LB1]AWN17747.1 Integrase [Salinisphaera sp. LB1]
MPLTAIEAKQAKPKAKQYKLADGGGLYLLVLPSGGKYWRMKYRIHGKEKTLAFGTLADVPLADARSQREQARKQLADGRDPMEVKRLQDEAAKANAANSFKAVALEWHDHKRPRWSEKHAAKVLRSLEADVFPQIGKRPIAEITAPELLRVIRHIEKRDALDYSHRVLQRIGMVFRYAIVTSKATYNPSADLVGALKTRKATHHAALSRDDLPAFLHDLDHYDGHLLTRYGLQLIGLTFLRTAELRTAEWHEIDFDRAEWRVPAHRMKMNHEHIVPLSTQAIDLLNALRPITGHYRYIFTGRNSTARPMSENTLLYALYRMGYKRQATVHGFRATASTILNESGFHRDAIERQLAHAERDKVRAAYHRSEYLDERRTMMQWWADYLDGLKRGANITLLHARA